MKIITCALILALFSATSCYEYSIYHGHVLDVNKLSSMSPSELDQYAGGLAAEELIRSKRSGSSGFISQLSSSVVSGVSKASAGASSALSSGASKFIASASGSSSGSSISSSSHGSSGGGYEYNKPKSTDFFTLKKSILNTIFQAIKAITGGVTILKGQLIKGGGALTSGVGKLISIKGEAVANFGKHLVNTASLSPPGKSSHSEVYVAPSGPPTSYGPPSSPATSFGSHSPPLTSYGPALSHSAPSSNYGAPSSFLPPSSSAPLHFASGPTSGHVQQTLHYPSHPNSLYGKPPKHTSNYEAVLSHEPTKYSPGGLQAGFIVMKNVDDSNFHQNYLDSDSSGFGKGQTVSTAVDALYGILKQPVATAPSGLHISSASYDTSNIYSPPPLPSSASDFTSSYDSYVMPFKPLNIPSYKNSLHNSDSFSAKSDDYGPELSAKLMQMIDQLLGVKPHPNKAPHGIPPTSSYLYDAKPSHSSPSFVVKKPGLDPVKLSKVNDNLDKLQAILERRDSGRSLSDPFSMYDSLSHVLKAIQEGREKQVIENKSKEAKAIKNRKSDEDLLTRRPELDTKEDMTAMDSSLVQKSLVYELRGDKLVQLTDGKTDS